MQFATNYLGHFALTGLLLPQLRLGRQPRVVQISSWFHRCGAIHFDDLQGEIAYRPWAAYFQSKLASLLFARQLQVRSDRGGWRLLSSAAHPGLPQTNLFSNRCRGGRLASFVKMLAGVAMSHSAAEGARPALFASVSEDTQPGGFYGPAGPLEFAGPPAVAHASSRACDMKVASRLWRISEELTGILWPHN